MKVSIFYYSMTRQCEAAARAVRGGPPRRQRGAARPRRDHRAALPAGGPVPAHVANFFATLAPTMHRPGRSPSHRAARPGPRPTPSFVGARPVEPSVPAHPALLPLEDFRAHVAGKPVGSSPVARGFYRKNLAVCSQEIGRPVVVSSPASASTTQARPRHLPRVSSPAALRRGARAAGSACTSRPTASAADARAARGSRPASLAALPPPLPSASLESAVVPSMPGWRSSISPSPSPSFFFSARPSSPAWRRRLRRAQFFQRCVGLFLRQYAFVQGMAARTRSPTRRCLT